jgi:hypothetical protein
MHSDNFLRAFIIQAAYDILLRLKKEKLSASVLLEEIQGYPDKQIWLMRLQLRN